MTTGLADCQPSFSLSERPCLKRIKRPMEHLTGSSVLHTHNDKHTLTYTSIAYTLKEKNKIKDTPIVYKQRESGFESFESLAQ